MDIQLILEFKNRFGNTFSISIAGTLFHGFFSSLLILKLSLLQLVVAFLALKDDSKSKGKTIAITFKIKN